MYKVIVAGSRSFSNYSLLEQKLIKHLKGLRPSEIEIVSGTAKGADLLGEHFAKQWGCAIKRFPADWNRYGKAAGPIRNEEMAKYADAAVIFWDGESKGTASMMRLAEQYGLNLEVITYNLQTV